MIRSMTGYGRAERTMNDRKVSVEIKSVNHRYNDLTIKLPRTLNAYEDKVRKLLSGQIFRGKTDVYINMDTYSSDDISVSFNETLTDAYMDGLLRLKKRYGLFSEPDLEIIAHMPDVITVERNIDEISSSSEVWTMLEAAVSSALQNFISMRVSEGDALMKAVFEHLEHLGENISLVKERAPLVASEYAEKLKAKLTEYLSEIEPDEGRLLTEVALFADRCCIDEELARLDSHMSQFVAIMRQSEPIGRKLDFLVQEMNREVNTIGSKSNDIKITKIVVDMKSQLEKIREQIQNIE